MRDNAVILKSNGLYEVGEAARLVSWADGQPGAGSFTCKQLRGWVDSGDGLLRWADVPGGNERLTFQALISLRLIFGVRRMGVPPAAITEGALRLQQMLEVDWPFASAGVWRREAPAFPCLSDLVAEWKHGREAMGFLELWLSENAGALEFNEFGLAYAWRPVKNVLIHEGVVRGKPCVLGSRTPVWVVHSLYEQGESIADIAYDYGFTEEKVKDAVAWGKRVASAAI